MFRSSVLDVMQAPSSGAVADTLRTRCRYLTRVRCRFQARIVWPVEVPPLPRFALWWLRGAANSIVWSP
jgi:hypothetical protein